MHKAMTLLTVFHDEPSQWGLRGDPYLWREMKALLEHHPYPETEEDFLALIERTYQQITGSSLEDQSSQDAVFIERYDHGGMSSGCVSPQFWLETGIPLLLTRYRMWEQSDAQL